MFDCPRRRSYANPGAGNLTIKEPILRVTDMALSVKNVDTLPRPTRKSITGSMTSRIAYIGETTTGISRIANSAAERAKEILSLNGFKHLDFYIIHARGKQKVKTWEMLERDLLLVFRAMFGEVPKEK